MASREDLLQSIKPDMKLTKDFLKRIYGYGVTDASFPDRAIVALKAAGCSRARYYYESWVNEYETARDAELKEVAAQYRKECEKKQKEGGEKRKQKKQTRSERWTELSQILSFQ